MKKVCIQAGHGQASGGAPGEMIWTQDIVKKIQSILDGKYEVYITGKLGYQDEKVTKTDWDLFLAVHYDSDTYNDSGGFTDYPEPSTDDATEYSQKYAKAIADYYFPKTGIKYMPQRSVANTRYYYMWKWLSKKTPCVLIECGIGNRKPQDYERLRKDDIPQILADSIIYALEGVQNSEMDYTNFNPKEDIPSIPEEKLKLKDYSWYDKKWTWEDAVKFTNDKVKESEEYLAELGRIRNENELLRDANSKLTNDVSHLTGQNQSYMNEVKNLNNQIESLNEAKKGYEQTINDMTENIMNLQESLNSCKEGTLDNLHLSDFLAWVGLKLGIKKKDSESIQEGNQDGQTGTN